MDMLNRSFGSYYTDELSDYPPLTELFRERKLTASEIDVFLTMMEAGVTLTETPRMIKEDMHNLHGDAILYYADILHCGDTDRAGRCLVCGVKHGR
jgi:hypothetical protein